MADLGIAAHAGTHLMRKTFAYHYLTGAADRSRALEQLMSAAPIADPKLAKNMQRVILEGDVPSPLNPPSGCPFRTRCRYATSICAEQMPELENVSRGHMVACHHML